MSRTSQGYLIALIAIVIWSTSGIFIGHLIAIEHIPPLLLALWRNVLVCVALVPVLAVIRPSWLRLEARTVRFYMAYGLILALFNSIWTVSVQTNGAAVATVLAYSSAGFTAVFAWYIFGEPIRSIKIIAIVLSLLGCVLVSNAYDPTMWTLNPMGVLTGLLSGVLFASYNMMGKAAAQRQLNPWTSLLYSFAFSSVFILLFNGLSMVLRGDALTRLWPQLSQDGWGLLLVLSFIPTVLGFGLYNTSMNYLPASTVSLLATSEPVMTAIEAYLILNERMTSVQIVGSVVILSAVIIMRFDRETKAVA